jgi:mono/diheme cytochrome c family protein/DNA-binding beta-propeller fold protein YncE
MRLRGPSHVIGGAIWLSVVALVLSPQTSAVATEDGETLYRENCAVCHGADLGGFIGPALNRESLRRMTEAQIVAKAKTGGVGTLMPPHPTFFGKLSTSEIAAVASFVKSQDARELSWSLDDIRASLTVLVGDEAALPTEPTYQIDDLDDLMAVMARGLYAAGADAKVVFFDGRRHRQVGEIGTEYAPHLLAYHPRDERWAYALTDAGSLFKIDLYTMQAVRRVRIGLNSASLAVSRDGRFVAAGSFVPNTAAILDAVTLEPLKGFDLRGVDPDGRMVESDSGFILGTPFADYFVIALKQAGQVWIVDLSDPAFPVTKVEKVGRRLHDAFRSPDGRHLAIASYDDDVIAILDLATKQVVKRLPAGRQPHVGSGAVIQVQGRTLGIGTNIGVSAENRHFVTVFDMDTFEVVKQIPVEGPTESPAAHPKAPFIIVDIVGTSKRAAKIQAIHKTTLEVVKTISVGGHSHFPEYTARGDFLYVSAGYRGDTVVVYRAEDLKKVDSISIEVPSGIFSHARARSVAVGLEPRPE